VADGIRPAECRADKGGASGGGGRDLGRSDIWKRHHQEGSRYEMASARNRRLCALTEGRRIVEIHTIPFCSETTSFYKDLLEVRYFRLALRGKKSFILEAGMKDF
jgi:hypothetical protein